MRASWAKGPKGSEGIFRPFQHLHFSSVGKTWNKNYKGTTQDGIWTRISVSQQRIENENCVKYRQVVRINEEEEFSHINKAPQEFQQVEV